MAMTIDARPLGGAKLKGSITLDGPAPPVQLEQLVGALPLSTSAIVLNPADCPELLGWLFDTFAAIAGTREGAALGLVFELGGVAVRLSPRIRSGRYLALMPCPRCPGDGYTEHPGARTRTRCTTCGGRGEVGAR